MTTATERLMHAGNMLANCAFNLAQDNDLDEHMRKTLDQWRKEWDDARTAARALAAPAHSDYVPVYCVPDGEGKWEHHNERVPLADQEVLFRSLVYTQAELDAARQRADEIHSQLKID